MTLATLCEMLENFNLSKISDISAHKILRVSGPSGQVTELLIVSPEQVELLRALEVYAAETASPEVRQAYEDERAAWAKQHD